MTGSEYFDNPVTNANNGIVADGFRAYEVILMAQQDRPVWES
jgi:hypothetical protein